MGLIHKRASREKGLTPRMRFALDLFEKHWPGELLLVSGFRTEEEAAYNYSKGRTIPGVPPYTRERPLGGTVTEAKTVRDTPHGRGAAVDLAPILEGRPVFDTEDADVLRLYHALGRFGEAMRGPLDEAPFLRWGGRFFKRNRKGQLVPFFDGGHFELAGWELLPAPPFATPQKGDH